MKDHIPSYLTQGERARLFPVLSNGSKEGRTTSIVLACLEKITEFGAEMLATLGQTRGVRAKLETFTEVVFDRSTSGADLRPDGMIILTSGKRVWRALVEAKIGNAEIDPAQVAAYRKLAKEFGIDCILTISNQFATVPSQHPDAEVAKSKSKVPVFHCSWMHVLTTVDLLLANEDIADRDQRLLLNELRRFLTHESAGVKGFDRMPKEWSELVKLVSAGGTVSSRSPEAKAVIDAWYQESRDLALILSRMLETRVSERYSKRLKNDKAVRITEALDELSQSNKVNAAWDIPDAAAPLEVSADLARRTVDVGMMIKAPLDRVSTKARLNWLLKQLKGVVTEHVYIRLHWPGRNEPTQKPLADLFENVECATVGKDHLAAHSFYVFASHQLGPRFSQQVNFISDIENVVPDFYRDVGSNLVAWKKPPPRVKSERATSDDVSTTALSEDANEFQEKRFR